MTSQVCVAIFERHRLTIRLVALAFALALTLFVPTARTEAACTVPNPITNGQVADATAVMGNFNALNNCVNSAVSPSGSPSTGNLPVFSAPNTITNGNLSGDCTTAGTLAVTCTRTNGSSFGYFATGTDAAQLTGTISVNRFNNGVNADSTHFLRGDGVWATPSGGGGGASAEAQWTIPNLANFSWTNQGSTASAVATPFGIAIRDDTAAATGNFRILDQAAPTTTPWTVYARISPFLNPTSGAGQSAIVIRNATSGKLLIAGAWNASPGAFIVQRWANATTWSATQLNTTLRLGSPYWVAITHDGTNLSIKLSADGYTWGPAIYSEALTSFLGTADRIGFGIQMNNQPTGMVVNSFSTTAPAS